jgi:hypothetical protein
LGKNTKKRATLILVFLQGFPEANLYRRPGYSKSRKFSANLSVYEGKPVYFFAVDIIGCAFDLSM